jgi:5,5'-dehydrodivanillate O-demethylase
VDLLEQRIRVSDKDFHSTKPGTLAGRYLRRFWQPVARSCDVAAGRAYPVRLMSESLTLYRGESGAIHAAAAHCPHRATLLATGWVEGDAIRCRYHGWKFGVDGGCLEQPGEEAGFAHKVRLRTYPAQEYLGLVFVFLGPGAPPPLHRFPDFERPGVVEASALLEEWPCNYFNRLDNACDMGHLQYTHRESLRRSPGFEWRLVPATVTSEETVYGIRTSEARPGRPTTWAHFHMPNVNQVRARRRFRAADGEVRMALGERLFWRVPVEDERSRTFTVEHLPLTGADAEAFSAQREERERQQLDALHANAAAFLGGEARIEDLGDGFSTYEMFWMEDYTVQVGQLPIGDERDEHLGRMDVGVILLRRLWRRELQALADGRALTDWVTPAGLSQAAE